MQTDIIKHEEQNVTLTFKVKGQGPSANVNLIFKVTCQGHSENVAEQNVTL